MYSKLISAFMALLLFTMSASAADGDLLTSFSSYLADGADAQTVEGLRKERVIYQDFDPSVPEAVTTDGFTIRYTGKSMALTGIGSCVNKLVNAVGVANAYTDMENLVDDDLDNVATIAKGVAAKVTVDPLVSVRDSKHYYAKGTTAGFCIVAGSGTSVLKLSVVKAMAIGFYRDGKLVGTAPVSEGQDASGVSISLVQIGVDGVMTLTAIAPDMFDEISLNPAGGVQLELASDLNVKYAFAGKQQIHILNRDWTTDEGTLGKPNKVQHDGGISKYNKLTGRKLKIDYAEVNESPVDNIAGYDKFVENPEEGALVSAGLAIGGKGSAQIHLVDEADPGSEVFPAGTEVGFKVTQNGLLKLGVGSGCYIAFYNQEYKSVGLVGEREYTQVGDNVTLSAGVLDVTAVQVSSDGQFMSAIAPVAFSGARLFIGAGLEVSLGGLHINYAYIREKPEQAHSCPLAYSSDVYLAEGVTTHQLTWNKTLGLPVGFTLVDKPEGSTAEVNEDGLLYNIDKKGKYTVKLQVQGEGHEDCNGLVVITNDQFEHTGNMLAGGCGEPLINDTDEQVYKISDQVYESSGSLISISDIDGTDNIVDNDPDNYAIYTGGLSIADNKCIFGVKRADGGVISDGKEAKRVGFVVEESTDGLNAKALEFLQIRCYYKAQDGSKAVYSHAIDESNAISAQVIGTGKTTKVRYSIEVPAGLLFDEIQMWTSGVLKLSASNIKFYYPFIEEANSPCSSLLGCNGELLGAEASVVPLQAGGINIAQVVDNTSFLIDDDYNTCMAVQNTVSVGGGVKVRINLGRTVHPSQNVGIILDDRTLLAGVKAGNWMKVRLYNSIGAAAARVAQYADASDDAVLVDDFSDWHVADAKVAGSGDKRALYFTPSAPFNELELEIAGIAEATDTQKYYGICLRGDADRDGVPDCMDPEYTKDIITGIEQVAPIDSALAVSLNGNVATAKCPGSRISRLLVYDIDGVAIDGVDGCNAECASIALPSGVSVLQVVFESGAARSLKLCVR